MNTTPATQSASIIQVAVMPHLTAGAALVVLLPRITQSSVLIGYVGA
jgi:hypothetical protein